MSIPPEAVFANTVSSVLEANEPSFTFTNIEEHDVKNMIVARSTLAGSTVDLDYLMIQEKCNVLLGNPVLEKVFGDLSCKFFNRPIREGIYSASHKYVLSIARIGDYKVSLEHTIRGSNEDVDDSVLNVEGTSVEHLLENGQGIETDARNILDEEDEFRGNNSASLSDINEVDFKSSHDLVKDQNLSNINDKNSISCNNEIQNNNQSNHQSIEPKSVERSLEKRVTSILSNIKRRYLSNLSFDEFCKTMITHFNDSKIIIWKFGQKIPIRSMLQQLTWLIVDAKLSVEIALGVQARSPDSFVSAKLTDNLKQFAFSNFLTNTMCNVRINQPHVARIYSSNCYRLVVYNTFQHVKKGLNYLLSCSTNSDTVCLQEFENSFNEFYNSYCNVIERVFENEIRLETYLVVNNLNELHQAIDSVKDLLPQFKLVKIDSRDLYARLDQYGNLLRDLFSLCKSFVGIEVFHFFLFYQRFITFMDSSQRTTNLFLQANIGLAVPTLHLNLETKIVTERFFHDTGVVKTLWLLEDIFGTGELMKPIIGYIVFNSIFFSCFLLILMGNL